MGELGPRPKKRIAFFDVCGQEVQQTSTPQESLEPITVARFIVRVPTIANESLDSIAATSGTALQALLAPGAGRDGR